MNRVPVIAGVARDENLVAYADTASQYHRFTRAQYGSRAGQIQRLSSAIAGGPLDPDQKVLQDEEVADVTTFARTGSPSAVNTTPWSEYNGSRAILSLQPGGDSEPTTATQIRLVHHCGFWNSFHNGASAVQSQ